MTIVGGTLSVFMLHVRINTKKNFKWYWYYQLTFSLNCNCRYMLVCFVQPIHICMTQRIEYEDKPPRGLEHWFAHLFMLSVLLMNIHRVPKLATPLASNTINSVWSSWISRKYRTLHYLNITYCREQVYKVKVNDVDELRQRIQSPDCMGWTWPAYYDKAIKQWRTRLRAYVEAKRWPLRAQTVKTSSEWSSPWMFHIL